MPLFYSGGEKEWHSARGNRNEKMLVNPDTILPHDKRSIVWCHHNIESQWAANLQMAALTVDPTKDPILNRTFGALVRADGCKAVSDKMLESEKPVNNCSVKIFPFTEQADAPEAWRKSVERMAAAVSCNDEKRFSAHQDWWRNYWEKSWIMVSGGGEFTIPVK